MERNDMTGSMAADDIGGLEPQSKGLPA